MKRLFLLFSLVFFAFPGWAQNKTNKGTPTAQTSNDQSREQAANAYHAAETNYKLQKYQEALEGFQLSYTLSNEPSILFNIAQCQRRLGQLEEAKKSFEFFLRDAPTHPKKTNAEKLIKEIDTELERLASLGGLKLTSSQDPASVFIDGVYKGESPIILLGVEPGLRSITIKKKGFADSKLSATIKPSQTVDLRIPQLAPSTVLVPKPFLIVSAASGGASLAAFGGLFIFANKAFDTQNDGKLENNNADDELDLLARKTGQAKFAGGASLAFALGAVVSFGVGVAVKKLRKVETIKSDDSLIDNGVRP
jgi:tetratricopeptide (TPR) repeat protein